MRRAPHIWEDDTGLSFLTAADIPADVSGLRPGEAVLPARLRRVCRTGYRLRADDPAVRDEAAELLRSPQGRGALSALAQLAGRPAEACLPSGADADPGYLRREMCWLLQRAIVRERRFGGPARGAWVADCGRSPEAPSPRHVSAYPLLLPNQPMEVRSVRRCWAGARYAASGGMATSWGADDWEPGGLSGARSFVVVTVDGGLEMLSGDLRPLCPARCRGRLDGAGGYVHAARCRRDDVIGECRRQPPPCECIPGLPASACSRDSFIRGLPADDPVRLRDEADDPNLSWDDPRWSGEGCRCAYGCHDGEDG